MFGLSCKAKAIAADDRGTSILIALAFMLVCVLVSVVVISSASVNAERIRNYQKEQQAYLSLTSALDLAEDLVSRDGSLGGIALRNIFESDAPWYAVEGAGDEAGIAQWLKSKANKWEELHSLSAKDDAYVLVVRADGKLGGVEVGDVTLTFTYEGENKAILVVASDNTGAYDTTIGRYFKPDSDDESGSVVRWVPMETGAA